MYHLLDEDGCAYENVVVLRDGTFRLETIENFESHKYYIFNEAGFEKISTYTNKIQQLTNSIAYKAKVNELIVNVSGRLLIKYLPQLGAHNCEGIYIHLMHIEMQHGVNSAASRFNVSIFSDVKQKTLILEWLNEIYEAEDVAQSYEQMRNLEKRLYEGDWSDTEPSAAEIKVRKEIVVDHKTLVFTYY